MFEGNSHIALIHDERIPEDVVEEFSLSVSSESLILRQRSRPAQGPQMSLEWFPLLAIFVMAQYFNGFLNEAGRDHYFVLRNAHIAFWSKFFGNSRKFQAAIVTASGIKDSDYSVSFGVYTVIDNGKLIKLLFREDCSEADYIASIDAFLGLLDSYHSAGSCENIGIDLDDIKGLGNFILLEYDKSRKSLRVIDPIPRPKDGGNADD